MTDMRHALGERAEEAVAGWLEQLGWRVLARRWRCGFGEIDLVCRDPAGALVAVEVKLRRSVRTGRAVEAVDARRLGRLRRSLAAYAHDHPAAELRVDLVTVAPSGERWAVARLAGIDGW